MKSIPHQSRLAEGRLCEETSHVSTESGDQTLGKTGGSIVEDDECEVALLERFKPPMAGVHARVTTVQGDPAQVSDAISNFKENIVPAIEKQSSVRTAYFFVNRQSGKTFAGSIWDTEHDLQKSDSSIGSLRADAIKKFGGRPNATFSAPGDVRLLGKDAVMGYTNSWMKALPDAKLIVTHEIVSGPWVVQEFTFEGTQGPADEPDGHHPGHQPQGLRPVRVDQPL